MSRANSVARGTLALLLAAIVALGAAVAATFVLAPGAIVAIAMLIPGLVLLVLARKHEGLSPDPTYPAWISAASAGIALVVVVVADIADVSADGWIAAGVACILAVVMSADLFSTEPESSVGASR